MQKEVINLIDAGADATGAHDATEALRKAIATGKAVLAPYGLYRLSGLITGLEESTEQRPSDPRPDPPPPEEE